MDADDLKARLALIESWRLAPIAVSDYCEDIDPEGIAIRAQNYKTWQTRHAALATKVRSTFEALIPVALAAESGVTEPLEEIRGRIMMDSLNALFYGKSETGMRTVCRHYIGSPASMNVAPVQESLKALQKWRTRTAPRQPSR